MIFDLVDRPDSTLVGFGDLKMIMPRTTVQTPNSTLVVFEVVLRARMLFVSGTHNGTEYLGNILNTRVMLR